ncbi:glutamine synthetase family protein [Nitratireductor soli]|uniref:glutamine synthetase family protein n=1 Tax=Nitratireductor soli TaxID=1670619 RepID=UPI000A72E7FA|nr:glutamine synthetase family protein [Nitratireductor soli]
MQLSDLQKAVEAGEIDTVIVATPDMQGRLVGKRLTARHFLAGGQDGVGTCSVVLTWGHNHSLDPGYALSGWDNGYPDMIVVPEMSTLASYAWSERTAFVMGNAKLPGGGEIDVAPRTVLAKQIAALEKRGLKPSFASELEFYLLRETPETAYEKGYVNLSPKHSVMHPETLMRTSEDEHYFGPLRNFLEASGVEVEMFKAEYSPGQVEINLQHQQAMKSADNHLLLKAAAKEIALSQGMLASFMAKIHEDMGGSSCHVHMSLSNEDGSSAFANGADGREATELMTHFIGGLTTYIRDIFLFFAPNTNSYRRLQPNTFAPNAVTWGEDNRTVAFRMVGKGKARRIENRIPGADINPYLAYSAMIAAGLRGVDEKLRPAGEAQSGNAYSMSDTPLLPQTLDEAIEAFETSDLISDVFGKSFRDHYANYGKQTSRAARVAVTDFERRMLLMDI